MKKEKKIKEKKPSLLRDLISVYAEQVRRRKALALLSKQSWSVDFLSLLLVKAAKLYSNNIELEITNKDGQKVTLRYNKEIMQQQVQDINDSILNHLDDDIAIDRFIRANSKR